MIPSVDKQIERMKELHPQFEVKFSTSWFVVWEGWLSPFNAKRYKIRIQMCRTKYLDDVEITPYKPRVVKWSRLVEQVGSVVKVYRGSFMLPVS